jgi:hypothetical protein
LRNFHRKAGVGVVTGYRASWSDGFIPFCDDGAKFAEVIQGDG